MSGFSILIPDGDSPFAPHVLACLARIRDVQVHLISKKKHPLTRFSRKTYSFHLLSEGQTLLQGVAEVCARQKIDLCMPVDTDGIYYFAENREALKPLVTLSLIDSMQNFRRVWDKGLLADFLFEQGLPHPATATTRAIFDTLQFPVLIKPRLWGGGVGIEKFTERGMLLKKIEAEPNFFDQYIVQSFLEGNDIDCSVLCKDGEILAYTIQRGLFDNVGFQAADAIEFLHDPDVIQVTSSMMHALRWNGVAHVDLRRGTDGRVVVIEINPRFWGSLEGSLHAGVNFPHLMLKLSLGESFPQPEFSNVRYAGAFSTIKRKLKRKPSVNLLRETNLTNYFYDPLPALARLAGVE
jgi:glutathione synthase/RimK-type ligase-like ATP-grasp enzyme